jgi:hypothetical protein
MRVTFIPEKETGSTLKTNLARKRSNAPDLKTEIADSNPIGPPPTINVAGALYTT